MKCELCGREATPDLCGYHAEARKKLESAYQAWKEAYGFIGWTDYLNEIIKNRNSGQWVVEVAQLALKSSRDGNSG